MWAGVTPEFFTQTDFPANADVVIEETYSPTVGLANVAQASHDYLANFYADDVTTAHLQNFSAQPGREIQTIILADSKVISQEAITIDPAMASQVKVAIPDGAKNLTFKLVDDNSAELLMGELALN